MKKGTRVFVSETLEMIIGVMAKANPVNPCNWRTTKATDTNHGCNLLEKALLSQMGWDIYSDEDAGEANLHDQDEAEEFGRHDI
ncbi:hypothetical protein VNO78_10466 [Psophocarpus tetragonolobus]|uniref:Uncharacterized protein n=1 Tax=Psophocarpus tetragonolobus TaxID=3891 RepID=A0AAN9SM37_PSOTE